jgi:hypothetical protein
MTSAPRSFTITGAASFAFAGANMADYMKSTPSGDPYLDFSALTRSAAKGIPPILAPPGIRRARTVDNQVADPGFIHSKRPGLGGQLGALGPLSIGTQKEPRIGMQKGPLCGVGAGLSR